MKKIILSIFGIVLICITSEFAYTYSNSAPPDTHTGAPGETDCTDCHNTSPVATSGTIWNSITLTSSVSLASFQPNTTYTLNLSFADPNSVKYGFEIVALPSSATSSSSSVGTFIATSSETALQIAGSRKYISHSATGTSALSNNKTWSFNWTTPASPSGTTGVKFYVAVNSTNNDGTNGGDQIYTKVFTATVLPVKWFKYAVNTTDEGNKITWTTAEEINNEHFEIEKCTDAKSWESIVKIKAAGTTNQQTSYEYTDITNTNNKVFYRIKQVDFDGNVDYSKTLTIDETEATEKVTYSQENGIIYIDNTAQMGGVTLFNLKGNSEAYDPNGTNLNVGSLGKGIYVLQLPSGKYQKIYIY